MNISGTKALSSKSLGKHLVFWVFSNFSHQQLYKVAILSLTTSLVIFLVGIQQSIFLDFLKVRI